MRPSRGADRARVYRLLSRIFQPPDRARLDALRAEDLPELAGALERLGAPRELVAGFVRLGSLLERADPEELRREYEATFEPSSGAARPPNETAFAPRTPQEGLTRTFELADVAGFYRAFGVEVVPGTERVDHVAAELEFMHLLAVKEAVAEERGEREGASTCRAASAAFLREHLGRWSGLLESHLATASPSRAYRAAGRLLAGFVELELAS